jgi:opacity protein-like surface antigen
VNRRLLVLFLLGPAAVPAQTVRSPEELERIRKAQKADTAAWARPTLSLVPKVGVFFGAAPFGPDLAIEFSYAPPVVGRQLLLGVDLSFQHSAMDGGGYHVGVNQLVPMALVAFHPYPENWAVAPYAGMGAGFCAMHASTAFTGNFSRDESELRFAWTSFAGLQVRAGSAALEVEVRYVGSSSATMVLKDSSVAPVQTTLGYRISL